MTGAGGSIGSELCYQIAQLGPEALTLYDRYENKLFAVANNLASRNGHWVVHGVVGDVTDRKRCDAVMSARRLVIVLHSGAHKHMPLMEDNPCEAVKNHRVRHGITSSVTSSLISAVAMPVRSPAARQVSTLL